MAFKLTLSGTHPSIHPIVINLLLCDREVGGGDGEFDLGLPRRNVKQAVVACR